MANVPDGFPGDGGFTYHETFQADKVYLYVQGVLSDFPGIAKNAKFEAVRQAQIDNMVMRIVTWCVSGRIEDTVTTHKVSYPDGAWQMFKEAHLPYWFKQRFPVRMKTVEVRESVSHYFVCPHLVTDEDRSHVQFMATGRHVARKL